jgi:hypothetical protein
MAAIDLPVGEAQAVATDGRPNPALPVALDDVEDDPPNLIAFLLGGIVIAGGLCTFVLLDSGTTSGRRGLNEADTGVFQLENHPPRITVPAIRPAQTETPSP